MAKQPGTMSPYQRYNKAPYRYSDIYYQWRSAVLKGDTKGADRLSARHFAKFGPPNRAAKHAALAS